MLRSSPAALVLFLLAACSDSSARQRAATGASASGDVPAGSTARAAVGDTASATSPSAGAPSGSGAASSPSSPSSGPSQAAQGGTRGAHDVPGGRSASPLDAAKPTGSPTVRALYMNRFAAQSARRLKQHIAWADSTEINALVVDMKDEFGLNYKSANPDHAKYAGTGYGQLRDVKALTDSLHAHGILAIARIVVFKDPVAARENASWTIRTASGDQWRDHKGTAWVNPYDRRLWAYNIGVAEELVKLGFDEIQWDYIRFPEPFASLPKQVFAGSNGMSKPDALAAYLKEAKSRLNALGVRSTADIFGLVTTVHGPLEVGQWWEKVSPQLDVVLPMVYPSHYPPGSFGLKSPNRAPYETIKIAIDTARIRDAKLGVKAPEHVRPWLQAFSLYKVEYGAEEIRKQKQAVYDAGYDGWVLWHPGSKYEPFIAALEKGEVASRRKAR